MMSDLLEGAALACLTVAAFVLFHLAGVLIAGGVALMYLSRVYADQPLPKVKVPTLRLPRVAVPRLKRVS